jgi:hypothetical protein
MNTPRRAQLRPEAGYPVAFDNRALARPDRDRGDGRYVYTGVTGELLASEGDLVLAPREPGPGRK